MVVLPRKDKTIAVDSALDEFHEISSLMGPRRKPMLTAWEWTEPNKNALAESAIISAFYEGVQYAVGEQRRAEYLRAKQLNNAGK